METYILSCESTVDLTREHLESRNINYICYPMLWEQILDEGYDELVYIPMSSGLSSSCATAKMLAEDYDGKVFVVDNHRISVTQRYSVFDALALA